MKEETKKWLNYAGENLQSARVLLDSRLYNPCLQNVQQSVEKTLKAVLVESDIKFKKTHSIGELVAMLAQKKLRASITEEECDLLDSIYLPSKYPLGSVLPDFEPDLKICERCISIAERVKSSVEGLLSRL
jgi:HEPN domain-containing protein